MPQRFYDMSGPVDLYTGSSAGKLQVIYPSKVKSKATLVDLVLHKLNGIETTPVLLEEYEKVVKQEGNLQGKRIKITHSYSTPSSLSTVNGERLIDVDKTILEVGFFRKRTYILSGFNYQGKLPEGLQKVVSHA